jgi:hypothetical protein
MAKQTINIGTAPNDGTGTPLRTSFDYCNLNFTELYTAVGPSGNNIVVPGSATITGDLTVDTSTLKVDSTNNRVGIGTASPGFALDIIGSSGLGVRIYESSTGNNNRLQITQEGTETRFNSTFSTGSAFYTWQIAGSTAMTLNSTGLGVGTVANRNLDVRQDQSAATTARIQNQSVNAAAYSELNLSASGNNWGIRSGSTAANSNRLEFVVDPSGTNLSVMRLDTSGNVGVGVTPSASWVTYKALEFDTGIVSGSSSMALNRNTYFDGVNWRYKVTTSFGVSQYQLSGNGNHIWNIASSGSAGAAINGGTGAWTQAMTLDASGNLLVGTTSAGGNRLNVQTASGDCTTLIKSQAANVNSAIDYVSSYGNHTIRKSGTAVWDFGVINDSSATPAFKISNASAVGVQLVSGATAWTTLSDETVKDIIEPIGNAVAKVGSLRSVIGKFKTDSEGTRRSFLIAQDVKSVLPEAVDVVGDNNELGLRYTEVIPLLVAAIKELTARVEALEA